MLRLPRPLRFVRAALAAPLVLILATPALADTVEPTGAPSPDATDAPHVEPAEPTLDQAPNLPVRLEWDSNPGEGRLVGIRLPYVRLELVGMVQGQAALLVGDDALRQHGDPAQQEGFRLRRARFGFGGELFDSVDFRVSGEFARNGGAELLDAWVGYHRVDWLGVSLGARMVPYSRYALTSARALTLIERPHSVNAMAPYRQVGVTLDGSVAGGIAKYWAGVYNGFFRNETFFEGFTESTGAAGNMFSRLAAAARVEIAPLGETGMSPWDIHHTQGVRFSLGASFYWNDDENVETYGWNADFLLQAYGFHAMFEYLGSASEPDEVPTSAPPIPAEVARMGLIGELGYITKRGWVGPGHLGVAVRGEFVDADDRVDDQDDQVNISAGISYTWKPHHVKIQLDYMHRMELHGVELDDDVLLMQMQLAL